MTVTERIARLHYITQDVAGVSHAELAERACRGGVRWVQARLKNRDLDSWYSEALAVRRAIESCGARLIVNDNPQIAREVGAHGVHLGPHDMPPAEARELLGPELIIGGSANSYEEACGLIDQGVDYLGLGPLRHTDTKEGLRPVLGFDGVSDILRRLAVRERTVPVVVIGGIKLEDTAALLAAGSHGVAVASAINLAAQPERAAKDFMNACG